MREYYYWKSETGPSIVYTRIPGMYSVMMGIVVKVGSIYEPKTNLMGASHFVEHMCFNGTHTRSDVEVKEGLSRYGGDINAYTTYDHTHYSCSVPKEAFDVGLDLITDLTFFSTMNEDKVEKERKIITSEIYRSQNSPWSVIREDLMSNLYGSSKFGHPILGYSKTVNEITRDELYEWYDNNYKLNNSYYLILGDLEPEEVKSKVEAACSEVNSGNLNYTPEIIKVDYNKIVMNKDTIQEDMVLIGSVDHEEFLSDDYMYKNMYNLWLGASGFTSQLFKRVREEKGLAYSVRSYYYNIGNTNLFSINCSTLPGKIEEAIATIEEIINDNRQDKYMSKNEFSDFIMSEKSNSSMAADDYRSFYNNMYLAMYFEDNYVDYLDVDKVHAKLDSLNYDTYVDKSRNYLEESTAIIHKAKVKETQDDTE